jgi:phosphoribosyl 1,2-cyclic phosphodiesterase
MPARFLSQGEDKMKAVFYGARGSFPVSGKEYAHFGGNTACIFLSFNNGRVGILDAGTGIRKLGDDFQAKSIGQYDNIFIGLSHTHWDHIQGFPFFQPAYDSRRHFTIAICGKGRNAETLENIFTTQMQSDFFPVSLDKMGATFTFWQPDLTRHTTPSGVHIIASEHHHPGGAYGYRITEESTTLVYCTDIEHIEDIDPRVVALARHADLLIHDAQYSPEELKGKKGWGHSSWEQAVEVALKAGVKRLALYHHDPGHDDDFLLNMEKECRGHFPDSFFAREGMEIRI